MEKSQGGFEGFKPSHRYEPFVDSPIIRMLISKCWLKRAWIGFWTWRKASNLQETITHICRLTFSARHNKFIDNNLLLPYFTTRLWQEVLSLMCVTVKPPFRIWNLRKLVPLKLAFVWWEKLKSMPNQPDLI